MEYEVVDPNQIGRGYRNVAYQSSREGSRVILYGYDSNNNPKTFIIPHLSHALYEVKFDTNRQSIFGTNVATKTFDSSYERYKWLSSLSDSIKVFEAFRPETEFLHRQFANMFLDDAFNTQPLRTHFIDIEIAVENAFPHAKDAAYPINLITIYDTYYKRYYSWVLGSVQNTITDKDIIVFKFTDEEDLLHNFINWFKVNHPDVISGWNIRGFDMPYIIRRLENVLGEKAASYISPAQKYRPREGHDAKGRETFTYTITGVSQLDLLLLYRDKFLIAPSLDGGYSLDNVAEHELNENKLQYEGTIRDFYMRDFQKFFEYNVRDVELTVKLEEKLQLIPLVRRITSAGLCELETIYSSLPYLIGSLSLFARKYMRGKVFPSYSQHENERGDFEGAYVFPTQMGFYQHGIACIDLNSLYPNTIISLNCSPETKVGQVTYNDADNTVTIRSNSGKTKTVTKNVFDNLLKEKCILSKNSTLFFKHEHAEGVLPKWVEYFYNTRKKYQSKMKSLTKKNNSDLSEEEHVVMTSEKNRYESIQKSIKYMLNSVYGIMGTPYCPFYDIDLAQSVTLNGQFISKSTIQFANDHFKKYSDNKPQGVAIACDTDSIMMDMYPLTLKYAKQFDIEPNLSKFTRTQFKELSKELDNFVENDINTFVKNLINTNCHTNKGHHVRYGREYIASEGMFFKKKHYLVHIIDDEGTKTDKFKYSGIAVKKTQLPPEMKPFLKHIYEKTCIEHWTFQDYSEYLNNVFNNFKKYTFEDIAFNQTYNTEKQTTGYLKTERGTLSAVRGAHYYNQFIKDYNLSKKYDEIRLGDVIKFVYIYKNNKYNIDVIGFKDKFPIELKNEFKINYELMFQKLFIDTLDGYIHAMNFNKYNPANQMKENIFDL
jgi:DNA polymerase elongation subunit (family B)